MALVMKNALYECSNLPDFLSKSQILRKKDLEAIIQPTLSYITCLIGKSLNKFCLLGGRNTKVQFQRSLSKLIVCSNNESYREEVHKL